MSAGFASHAHRHGLDGCVHPSALLYIYLHYVFCHCIRPCCSHVRSVLYGCDRRRRPSDDGCNLFCNLLELLCGESPNNTPADQARSITARATLKDLGFTASTLYW